MRGAGGGGPVRASLIRTSPILYYLMRNRFEAPRSFAEALDPVQQEQEQEQVELSLEAAGTAGATSPSSSPRWRRRAESVRLLGLRPSFGKLRQDDKNFSSGRRRALARTGLDARVISRPDRERDGRAGIASRARPRPPAAMYKQEESERETRRKIFCNLEKDLETYEGMTTPTILSATSS